MRRASRSRGPETAELAVAYREDVKALIAEIEKGYKPHIANAHAAHKALCSELATRLAGPKAALDTLTRAIGSYELARRQREQQALREAEAAAQAQAAADRAKDAEAQRAKGNEALAKDIESSPIEEFMAPVVVAPERPTAGVAVTQTWSVAVTDLDTLVRYAARDEVTPQLRALLVEANARGLQALCDQMGESFKVPGCARVLAAPIVRSVRRR